jgi:membrane protease subunit (stomatin/prohibitin family)
MSGASETKETHESKADTSAKPKIHRVCISCNNMFEVTIDNYEAKHCPNCHKG